MAAQAEHFLPVEYFHVVFTLPAQIARIAYWNKKVLYDLLFKASAKTLTTIAADPKHLGAKIGMTSVLHTWGSALTHHPHVHIIAPGGGLAPTRGVEGDSPTGNKDDGNWMSCRSGFFLPVRVLSRLFRRLFLEGLTTLHQAGKLEFFGDLEGLGDPNAFAQYLAPLRKCEWVIYAKPPFGGPEAVLSYLSRYTHRVAISNSRLINADAKTVTFKWKDYRNKSGSRQSVMRLPTGEFIRRFLIHVLPDGFHRIRHYGLLASHNRRTNITKIRTLLNVKPDVEPEPGQPTLDPHNATEAEEPQALTLRQPCPDCGGTMRIIEVFSRGQTPQSRAPPMEKPA